VSTVRGSGFSILLAALWLSASGSLPAQTFTTLYLFGAGGNPDGDLVQGTDGNLYGVTAGGPGKGDGMIFKITPSGTLTTLHSGGGEYIGALVQGTDGNFYGTVLEGGTFSEGTVFKITPSGTLTTLHNFCSQSGCPDGQIPTGPLVQGTDGNLYGTTGAGGTGPCSSGCGTIFKITTTGTLTTLHSFDLTDGAGPNGGLVQATDGSFYGTTYYGGTTNSNCNSGSCGTAFKMTPAGTLTALHRFDYTDGANPEAALIQANDGNFYGTTSGTIFKITPTGTLTTLHAGVDANALVQDSNGTFYGTTLHGGRIIYHYCGGSCGTIFSLSVQ
jgi:uncharacterized repeat protein (TIGR03803 family)